MTNPVRVAKRTLRARLRAARASIPAVDLRRNSQIICDRVAELEVFRRARGVALYWPMLERGEVDVRDLDQKARASRKLVYYPGLAPDGSPAGFRLVERLRELAARGRGFAEPLPERPLARAGDVDLVVAPALGATLAGERLGQGGGFYDVVLAALCPPARCVVVVHELQLVAQLPTEPHDRRCDVVVTERRALHATERVL
jgi:5-formyltetrahydrofolate cyclo-ligase